MAESNFVKQLKKNLSSEISTLINNTWGLETFDVTDESKKNISRLNGRPDLLIIDSDITDKPIGIEIEHKSSFDQSKQNIKKFRDWAHNSQSRTCGLLHIFNNDSNLNENGLNYLIEYGKTNEHKQLGFYYETYFYKINDKRETRQTAIEIVSSIEFRTRLWELLRCVGLVKNA